MEYCVSGRGKTVLYVGLPPGGNGLNSHLLRARTLARDVTLKPREIRFFAKRLEAGAVERRDLWGQSGDTIKRSQSQGLAPYNMLILLSGGRYRI
jgi:hypothetical protein